MRRRVPVYCGHAPDVPWGDSVGMTTFWPPVTIWLRYCTCVRQLVAFCVFVFAHEIVHVEHPSWSEARVGLWDNWYAAAVVGPAIRREQA